MKGRRRPQTPPRGSARKTDTPLKTPPGANFRTRYDVLEREREALLQRLELHQALLADNAAARRAETLLKSTFRRVSLSQRAAVLQAAAWLIQVTEMYSKML